MSHGTPKLPHRHGQPRLEQRCHPKVGGDRCLHGEVPHLTHAKGKIIFKTCLTAEPVGKNRSHLTQQQKATMTNKMESFPSCCQTQLAAFVVHVSKYCIHGAYGVRPFWEDSPNLKHSGSEVRWDCYSCRQVMSKKISPINKLEQILA